MDTVVRHAFSAEWFDEQADLRRNYTVFRYVNDGAIEIYDIKNRRTFLRKTIIPGIEIHDVRPGSVVTIYNRQFEIIDFADDFTRRQLASMHEKTAAIFKPEGGIENVGSIIRMIEDAGLNITQMNMVQLTPTAAADFYAEHQGKPFFNGLIGLMTSAPIVVAEITGNNAIQEWRKLALEKVRPIFARDPTRNAVHSSDSPESATRELSILFGNRHRLQSCFVQDPERSCCVVIKPHAIREHHIGEIIESLQDQEPNLRITGMKQMILTYQDAGDFLEVYQGVYPSYGELIKEMSAGPVIAIEVTKISDDFPDTVVTLTRAWAGPMEPAIGKDLAPTSVRAKYGRDRVQNAVHTTDLDCDGILDSQFLFSS